MKKFANPEIWYHTLGTHYLCAQLYFEINQVGVIEFLQKNGPSSIAKISEDLKLEIKYLEPVLSYLSSVDELFNIQDGKVSITEFGKEIIKRFSRADSLEQKINMFDVRIGGFGPVWQNIASLLTKRTIYGKDIYRNNQYIERGLFKLSEQFVKCIIEMISTGNFKTMVEMGANTGIADRVLESFPQAKVIIIDRNEENLEEARSRIKNRKFENRAEFILADVFHVGEWTKKMKIPAQEPVLFYSVHFHEFIKNGIDPVINMLREIKSQVSHPNLLLLEQPHNIQEEKAALTESQWLYSQAHTLIHHIVQSGKILSVAEWVNLVNQSGFKVARNTSSGYLGFEALLCN